MIEQAKLAFLTQAAPGRFLLKVQTEKDDGQHLAIYEITADHVRGLVADGAAMAFRARETAE